MHGLRYKAEAQIGRLLRVLFLRLGAVSAHSGSARGRAGRRGVLFPVAMSRNPTTEISRDWLGAWRTSWIAWWIPKLAMIAGLLLPLPGRTAVWVIALAWMGAACMINARRCNRTHCRYTGPYYIATIAPVIAVGAGFVTVGILGWICLGAIILGGAGLIWYATERAWGKFS